MVIKVVVSIYDRYYYRAQAQKKQNVHFLKIAGLASRKIQTIPSFGIYVRFDVLN